MNIRFLKNRAYIEYFKQGFIIGNNVNLDYTADYNDRQVVKTTDDDDEDEKFDGALVANPMLNSHTGIQVLGRRSMFIFDNVIDMDFSSMYPNVIISFNISANSMIAKLIIGDDIASVSRKILNSVDSDIDDKGKEFLDNYLIGNYANMGKKWFNLPGIIDLDKSLQEKLGTPVIKTKYNVKRGHYFIERLDIMIGGENENITR